MPLFNFFGDGVTSRKSRSAPDGGRWRAHQASSYGCKAAHTQVARNRGGHWVEPKASGCVGKQVGALVGDGCDKRLWRSSINTHHAVAVASVGGGTVGCNLLSAPLRWPRPRRGRR